MKKAWFPALLVVVLIIVTVAYIRLVVMMSQNRPAFDALPEDCSVIFQFNNPLSSFEKFYGAEFFPQIKHSDFFGTIFSHITGIDTFLKSATSDTLFSVLDNSMSLAAVRLSPRKEIEYLYVIKKHNLSKDGFHNLMSAAEAKASISKKIFSNETIYEVAGASVPQFSCAFVNGLFLASYTSSLTEAAITQLRDGRSLLEDDAFAEVNELAGADADAVIYLHLPTLDAYGPLLVNEEADFFASIPQLGDWMELDLKIKDNSVMINGYTGIGRGTFLSLFQSEPAGRVEIARVLPSNTALFAYQAVSDFETHIKNTGKSLSSGMDNFRNWIGNEWCFGLLEPRGSDYESEVFLAVSVTDPEIAAMSLAEQARLSGDDLNLEEFRQFPIGQLSLQDDLNDLFDHQFFKIKEPYYVVMDEFVVFANDLSVIKTALQNYSEGQTLSSDPDYMTFERNLTTSANFYIYFNTARCAEFLNRILSNPLLASSRKGNTGYLKFTPAAIQFSHYKDIFFTNGYIQYSTQVTERSNRFWQVKLDARPSGFPAFVVNHYTGEKEIVMQDSLNNIYLITKNGRVLWKKQLEGPIMSEIFLVDFFENTKLQFAFSTKEKIHIIDRKGENVAGYPIKLPSTAASGMALFDYDKKKDYRLFVACENGNIYGYYKSGKPLPGWNPRVKTGIVRHPLKYVMTGGKDFLIAANEAGEVHLFNRRGELRAKPVKLEKAFDTDFQLRASKDNFQLLNADKDGNIYKVYRNASFSSQKQDALPKGFFDFIYTDLNADGKYEMIFVDSLVAKVFDEQFKEIASPSFADKIDKAFLVQDGKQRGIGFISRSGQKIYYVGEDYELSPSFPLPSCTPFIMGDLFETGRKVVIAGDCEGWVNAYQVK